MLALIDLQIKYLNFSKENSERGGRHMTQIVISLICWHLTCKFYGTQRLFSHELKHFITWNSPAPFGTFCHGARAGGSLPPRVSVITTQPPVWRTCAGAPANTNSPCSSSSATRLLIQPEEPSGVRTATPTECFALKILLSRCTFEKREKKESGFNNAQRETAQSNMHF